MRLPNNILSVEYLLCLKKYPNITPLFIQRNFEHISAGEIRDKIHNSEDFSSNVPQKSEFYLKQSAIDTSILTSLTLKGNYEEIYDCDYSLYNRILSRVNKSQSIYDLVSSCTTSAYTSSKVRRAIYSIFFGVKRSDVKSLPQFTILLSASKKGLEYLSSNKKNFEIPILTRSTDEKKYKIDTTTSLKPDKIYSILANEKYSPYKTPYIKN
jgi:predicted nucleotidyltransferase